MNPQLSKLRSLKTFLVLLTIVAAATGQLTPKKNLLLGNWEGTVVYDTSKVKLSPEQEKSYKQMSGFKVTMRFTKDGKYSGEQYGDFVANKAEGAWTLKGKELTLKLERVDGKPAKLPDVRLRVLALSKDSLKLEQIGLAVGGKMTMKRSKSD